MRGVPAAKTHLGSGSACRPSPPARSSGSRHSAHKIGSRGSLPPRAERDITAPSTAHEPGTSRGQTLAKYTFVLQLRVGGEGSDPVVAPFTAGGAKGGTMRLTQYFLPLLREVPSDAEIASHKLMLRAGM